MGDEEDYQSDGLTQDDLEEQLMDDVSLDMDVDDDVGNDLDADEGLDQSTVASSVDGGDTRKFRDTTSQFMQASQVSVSAKKGRERSNAKPVECLDMEGNLIKVYNSGTLAARDLNVQQGDISLCCRGLKDSVGGYRFRFSGAYQTTQPTGVKLKRGFAYVAVEEPPKTTELTQRTTRASRGEYGLARVDDKSGRSVLAPPSIKVLYYDELCVVDSYVCSLVCGSPRREPGGQKSLKRAHSR